MNKPTNQAVIFILLKFLSKFFIDKRSVFILPIIFGLSINTAVFAQLAVPFSPRLEDGNIKVKGDIVLIGNSIITAEGQSLPFNSSGNNNGFSGAYINEASGGDPSIFSSSSADLALNNSCKRIVYAGLYWASVYPNEVGTNSGQQFEGTPRLEDWNQVKFKLPTGDFIDLVADDDPDPVGEEDDIIFDGYDPVTISNSFKDSPIVCYKNVTNLLQGLTEADGTYTVANLRATRGSRTGGCAAGWTLVVIYESPTLPSKFISVFDGYAGVKGNTDLDIPVSGFKTLPAPLPVNAKIGVAALEGDLGILGDSYSFKASSSTTYTNISDALNLSTNFFNSKITNDGVYMNDRNPNSTNTLGFDIANVSIPNPDNGVLPNGATAGDLRLTTSGDGYGAFVTSFAVDIIEPNIILTKIVEDDLGNNIGGEVVSLGQRLNYVIGFQNLGNDDATEFTIRDVLPININFDINTDLAPLPTGVSIQSYDPTTRELIFEIDDSVVEEFDPVQEIRFSVQVVEFCNQLDNACSNSINNQAYATYKSKLNPTFIISDDPSFDINNGCLLAPQATNFLTDIESCSYYEEVILCGSSTILTAPDGYDSYEWSTSPTFSPVIGTEQTFEITSTGTYYVKNYAVAPCQTTDYQYDVVTFGANVTNPVLPYADNIEICPNDGKQLPNIFLCGGIGGKYIQTNLSDTTSIIWDKLDESSCSAVQDIGCANEDSNCVWNEVATGPDFMADIAGQYRITLNYPGGCFNQFYFNVYTNLLSPNVTAEDIYCNSNGRITVGGVPNGYEYSIDGTNYQTSNSFEITSPGSYTVYLKQIGVTPNPCIFTVPNTQIRRRDFTVSTIINQPLCHTDQGNVIVAANDVRPQYSYSISQGTTVINSVGPILDGDYTFSNLNPGSYTINVTTEDGCTHSEDIEIIAPPLLGATSALTTPLTCADGEITITPSGGTGPYFYFLNGSSDFETVNTIPVTAAGTYDVRVVDSNNCSTSTSIRVDQVSAPVFDVDKTDILCYGANTGVIQFNVTNANGHTIEYSIDNGSTYSSNTTFSNLISGTYQTMIRYTLSGIECLSVPTDIEIVEPLAALTASAGVSQLAGCGPSGEGALRITNPQGGVSPYEFSFDNQSSWTTNNEAFLAPGTYTVYVRDANGCIFPMTDVTIDQQPLAPIIDISDPEFNCDGSANATVTVTNSGTDAFNYTYLLDDVENSNTADPTTFLNVSNGNHVISVLYDLQTVTSYSNLLLEDFGSGQDVSSPGINSAFCFERQVSATACNGDSRLGNGEYTITNSLKGNIYSGWNNPVDHTAGSNNGRYMAVDAGNVIPNNAVLYRKTINDIIPNQPIQVRFYATNLLKVGNTQPDASLTVELQDTNGASLSSQSTGGIPKTNGWVEYNRTIDPGDNTSLDFVLRLELSQVNGIDFAVDDIQVYQLPKSCITQRDFPIVIESGNAFSATISRTTDVSCLGSTDGSITISAQNYDTTNGYEYSLDGTTWISEMTSPYTIQGLAEGVYNVQIRYDGISTGCEFSFNESISAPNALSVSESATPITCLNGATVTATGSGGTAPYAYELLDASSNVISNFPSSGILPNIAAGDYIIRVTDANDCTATTTLNLSNPVAPTGSIVNADYCYDLTNGAALEVSASGGQAPYQYNINGGAFQNNARFENLTPGTYVVVVRDAYGCEVTLPTETIAPQVSVSASLTKELDCTSSPDATISGTISNGYPDSSSNYRFAVSINGATFTDLGSTGTSFSYTAASSGTYQFQITDSNNCQALSSVITVNPVIMPTGTVNTVNPLCNGFGNGSVQIIPSSGVGPYEYSFNGSGFSSDNEYSGLGAGISYTYQIRDSKNCVFDGSFTLTEPTELSVSANATAFSCSTSNISQSATVTIDVPTTGTAPYSYSFNGTGYSSSRVFTVDDNGVNQTVNYYVQDAQGCIASGALELTALNSPTDLDFTATDVTCTNTTSRVALSTTNGVGTLSYQIMSPASATSNTTGSSSGIFTGLAPDTYEFRVTDENGCYYSESFTVNAVTNITVQGRVASDVNCFGGNNGIAGFRVNRYTSTYSYSFDGGTVVSGQTNPQILRTGLTGGSHTLEVTDDVTGCTASTTITVAEPSNALAIVSNVATKVHCNAYNSQITVTASGGTSSYRYAAVVSGSSSPGSSDYSNNNVINVDTNSGSNLVWDIYVRDSKDCQTSSTVTIALDPLPTVTVPTLATNQCTTNSGFSFTATGANGLAPYEYSINGGSSYQSNATFTVNSPGTYTVTIRDANGCTATSSNTVDIFEPLTGSAALVKDITCAAPVDASINITASGGNGAYSYEVSNDGGTTYTSIAGASYSTSSAGTYQFRITDGNNCTYKTNAITVSTPVNPDITNVAITQAILCNGQETGAIDITINSALGLAPFVINVNNDTTGRDYGTQTSGLDAGDYTITLTDANGCTDTETLSINEPDVIAVDYDVLPITCGTGGVSLGEIIINAVSGGTPNYTYHVTGVNGYNNEITNQTGGTQIFEVVDFGLYEILVTDANGCSVGETNIVVASPPDDLDINIATTVDCAVGGEANVSIGTSSSITGTGPFYFAIYTGPGMLWDGIVGGSPTWQLGAGSPIGTTFTGLIPDVLYTFIVYDDDTKCYYYESATTPIDTNSTLAISSLVENNITCIGSDDGNVSFDISSIYASPTDVRYEIFNSLSLATTGVSGTTTLPANDTVSIDNLGALPFGEYFVLVEELTGATNAGCSVASAPFSITESAIELSLTASSTRNQNCNELGLISAIAENGTAPYEYQFLLATATAPTAASSGWISSNTFEGPAESYTVYVKDAYGCIKSDNVTIDEDPLPTIDAVAQQCFDGTAFTININEGTGSAIAPLTYSIGTGGTPSAYQSSNIFTISSAGTYDLFIKDGNGCVVTETYVVQPALRLDAIVSKELDCTSAPNAEITLTASGGVGPYTYAWSDDNGSTYNNTNISGATFTATSAGDYIFRVTDSQGTACEAISSVVTVNTIVTPTLTEEHSDVSCHGGADGSITVTPVNGVSPFQFSIDGGTPQASNIFDGLSEGTYDIAIIDAKNCTSDVTQVVIDEPTALVVDASAPGFSCDSSNIKKGTTITIDVPTTGTAPYTYSFDGTNYSADNTLIVYDDGTDQTVNYYVQDANGCIEPGAITISALNPPTDLNFVATQVTCLDLDSDVTLTPTNGVGTLTYAIISPASATSNTSGNATGIYTDLLPDTYMFRVTDENGCYYTESFTVSAVTNITVRGQVVANVSCNTGSNGGLGFRVANYTSTYSYTINGGAPVTGYNQPFILVSGVSAGNQTIIVTDDATGCADTATVTVIEPTALSLIETANINANCNLGAQVEVEASGGTSPYTYAFVEKGATPSGTDYTSNNTAILSPSISLEWDVYVKDAKGCPEFIEVDIEEDPLPSIDMPVLAANQCNLNGDPFTFTATNPTGVGPYTYSIGNGFQSSPTFTVNAPGDYFVTIRDTNGCETTNATAVTIYPAINVSAIVSTFPSCNNDDGVLTLTGSGGSGNYIYSISSAVPSISITGNIISGVPSGSHTVTIEDTTTNCSKSIDLNIETATPVTFTTTPTAVSCIGGNDGSITVNLSSTNNNPVYTYSLDGGITTQNSNIFTDLGEGTYNITVISGRNCSTTQLETVSEPNAITIPAPTVVEYACTVNTNSNNFASIEVTGVTGGSSNYTIYEFIKNGSIVQATNSNVYTETDLLGGVYTINVYDDNGCFETVNATIQPYIEIDNLSVSVNNGITCNNDEDIIVSVNSTGGTPNLEYTVEDTDGSITGTSYSETNSTGNFNGLPIGDYIVSVINLDTGCTLQTVHYVNIPNTFDIRIDSVVDVRCYIDSNGSVTFTFIDRTPTPTDESGPFRYTIEDATGSEVRSGTTTNAGPVNITDLSSGTYTIRASLTNSPFCTVIENFTITAPAEPLAITETHTEITCVSGNNDGTIVASAIGGWPGNYEFQLALSSGTIVTAYGTSSEFTNLTEGDYTISVRDSKGCVASIDVVLENPTPIAGEAAASPTLLNCFDDANSSITVSNVRGGQGSNYTYTLNMLTPVATSSGPQTSPTFNDLGAGTYNVLIRDGYNCEFTTNTVVIDQPSSIDVLLSQTTSQTCLTGTTLTLSASGGTGPYNYSDDSGFSNILGSFTTDTSFDVTPGTYKYYVQDANGCTSGISNEITIDPLPELIVNIDAKNAFINCAGDNTGVIVAEAQGGLGNYTYTLQDDSGNDIVPAPVQTTPGVFTDLSAGNYRVYAESGIDCDALSITVSIEEPALGLQAIPETTDVTCSGGNDGRLEILATGGTGIIKYAISPQLNQFFDSPIFEDLRAGTYQVIAQDEYGCFELMDIEITEPEPVTLSIVQNSIIPELCTGNMDGSFSIELAGGMQPYSYSLDNIDGPYTTGGTTQTVFDFENLSGGDHIVYVRDSQDCESEWYITFPESVLINPQVAIDYGCQGNTPTNTVTVTVDESITNLSDLDYALNGGAFQASNVFVDVPAATDHIIEVRHSNGCIQMSDVFEIDQIDTLELTLEEGNLNQIVSLATGGTPPYKYELNGESSDEDGKFIIYSSGDYTVTVTDLNGCVMSATQYFEYIDVCIPNYFTPNEDGRLDGWGPGCTSQYEQLTLEVFDRYGRRIANLRVNEKWDGNYKGNPLPTGDYWYILKLNDPKDDREFTGHFTLYR